MTRLILCLCLLLAAVSLAGCAKPARDILLEQDYQRMTDTGIIRYFYDLDEAISACDARDRPDSSVSVGVGTGVWTGGGGFGVGVNQLPANSSCDSTQLRQRRTDVRLEMERRGIKP